MNIENLFVAIRYLLTALGSGMAGSSFADGSSFQFWAGIILAGVSAGYGQYKTLTSQQVKTLEKVTDKEVIIR